MAPQVGFEPTTDRLTADSSTTELLWINKMERVMGIEPTTSAWKAEVLPLNYTRLMKYDYGAVEGIEPSSVGTTIRCVNHFATTAKNSEWFRTESNCRHMELQSIALPTELLNHIVMAVSTGIEPAISCVTGRRVNRYTTRPNKTCIAGGGFEPPTFGL